MSKVKSALEKALDEAELLRPGGFPRPLPVGHIGSTEHLNNTLKSGSLRPRYCTVMRKQTLYLFYGGLFYRSKSNTTQEERAYPVGYLFSPAVIDMADTHFPFDTGAMALGIYGARTSVFTQYKKQLQVRSTALAAAHEPFDAPRVLVKHLFANNHDYVSGTPDVRAQSKPAPIPELFQFLSAPGGKSDHRRACIETQRYSPLSLDDKLLWLGYPDVFDDEVQKYLRRIEPHLPKRWPYPSQFRYRPSEVCATLQGRASEVLEEYLSGG